MWHLGHDVTLFASGDSITSTDLVTCAPVALRLEPKVRDPIAYNMLMLDRVREQADKFDIIHFHIPDSFHRTNTLSTEVYYNAFWRSIQNSWDEIEQCLDKNVFHATLFLALERHQPDRRPGRHAGARRKKEHA